ncbi:MAG TPA: hypothetical protein VFW17_05555 [Ktedonobacterales bacterium]|jgi:hypothetical protein|nr:hypothetical protein [Ktedonobacterales bacterium]
MLSVRSVHYWLWFILFGVVSSLVLLRTVGHLDSEAIWLLMTGLLGLLFGLGGLGLRLARPYDLIIGLVFTGVGLLGLLHNLGYYLVPADASAANAVDQTAIIGLSLALPYALIHTMLGLTSLSHGLRTRTHSPSVVVEPVSSAA